MNYKLDGHTPYHIDHKRLSSLKQDIISLGCNIDILEITYFDDNNLHYNKHTKMYPDIGGLQIRLSKDLLSSFKFTTRKREIYSTSVDEINQNFCFILGHNYKFNFFYIGVKLLRMPFGVQSFKIRFSVRYSIMSRQSRSYNYSKPYFSEVMIVLLRSLQNQGESN